MGAVEAVEPGQLTGILGTSVCWVVSGNEYKDVPGVFGTVLGGIVPGKWGFEAGQTAVGDIFAWFVSNCVPGSYDAEAAEQGISVHELLTNKAAQQRVGEHGLLALDWHNGNRSILCDPQLTGLVLGQTLSTTPAQVFRTLMEATAFGALTIVNRLEDHHVKVDEIVCCGPIAQKNPLLMQMYADVTGREIKISRSSQTCALGAAVAAAVAAGEQRDGYPDFRSAQEAMTGQKTKVFEPDTQAHNIYRKLYLLYRNLHDAFGTTSWRGNLHNVMKELIALRRQVTG